MAKMTRLGKAIWTGCSERVSDGWLIRVFNQGRVPSSFLLYDVGFNLPKGKEFLIDGAMIEMISEAMVNPGGEVALKFTVKQENLSELIGNTPTFWYGTGIGQYCTELNLTLN